jgi:hypothetical protein
MILAHSEEMDTPIDNISFTSSLYCRRSCSASSALQTASSLSPRVLAPGLRSPTETWSLAISGIFLDLLRLSGRPLTMHIERPVYDTGLTVTRTESLNAKDTGRILLSSSPKLTKPGHHRHCIPRQSPNRRSLRPVATRRSVQQVHQPFRPRMIEAYCGSPHNTLTETPANLSTACRN